jgi:hypothetical protein
VKNGGLRDPALLWRQPFEKMTFEKALNEAGVTASTLTTEEKHQLDEQGYVVLPAVYDEELLVSLQTAFEQVAARERQDVTGKESGTRHPRDLLNQDPLFIDACLHPKLLTAVHHVLARPFRLTQCSGRDPLPGYGQQGLHADGMPRAKGEPFYVATARLSKRANTRIARVGEQVTVFPAMALTCGQCIYCRMGNIMFCPARRGMGHGVNGAFATYAVVKPE